jgi:hypothetical protein
MNRAIPFFVAAALLAGCSTTGSLGTAADRLDQSAHRYYREVAYGRGPGPINQDAAELAEATREFNRAVDRAGSRDALQPSFDRVAGRYHELRDRVERRDGPYGESSYLFDRVTDAYLDVERVMNHRQ